MPLLSVKSLPTSIINCHGHQCCCCLVFAERMKQGSYSDDVCHVMQLSHIAQLHKSVYCCCCHQNAEVSAVGLFFSHWVCPFATEALFWGCGLVTNDWLSLLSVLIEMCVSLSASVAVCSSDCDFAFRRTIFVLLLHFCRQAQLKPPLSLHWQAAQVIYILADCAAASALARKSATVRRSRLTNDGIYEKMPVTLALSTKWSDTDTESLSANHNSSSS